jgi:hypothetical protein
MVKRNGIAATFKSYTLAYLTLTLIHFFTSATTCPGSGIFFLIAYCLLKHYFTDHSKQQGIVEIAPVKNRNGCYGF